MLAGILTLLKFLPDFVALAKSIIKMTSDGVKDVEIKLAMKGIDKAFSVKDPAARAREVNDEFRK